MKNDIFKIGEEADFTKKDTYSADINDVGDFKISKPSGVDALNINEGGLDDTRLSDDFIIGQDFFIDSTVADDIETQHAYHDHKTGENHHVRVAQNIGIAAAHQRAPFGHGVKGDHSRNGKSKDHGKDGKAPDPAMPMHVS